MKKILSLLSLAALTVGLLGSCSKINERIDSLEKRIDGIESTSIASVQQQIDGIKASITKLEAADVTVNGKIDELKATAETHQTLIDALKEADKALVQKDTELEARIASLESQVATINGQIKTLEDADKAINVRIDELKTYVDTEIGKTKDWAEETFATLEQYQQTADDLATLSVTVTGISTTLAGMQTSIAGLDTKIDGIDADLQDKITSAKTELEGKITSLKTELEGKIASAISTSETSIKSWINELLEGYYTIAQVDAKIGALNTAIEASKSTAKERIDSVAKELTTLKTAVDTAKAAIRAEYKNAIDEAINKLDGEIRGALKDSVVAVNGRIVALDTRVTTLELKMQAVEGRVDKLEAALGAYAELQGTITEIIKRLLAEVGDKPQSEQDATIWKCITALQAQCGTFSTAIQTLQGLVGSKDVATQISEAIASLISTQKLSGLADAVNALKDIVYGKGDVKSLTQQIADINEKLSTTYATKTQLGQDIATAKADLQRQIDSLCNVIGKDGTSETATGIFKKIAELNARVAALEAVKITIESTEYTNWSDAVQAVLNKVNALGIGNISGLQSALNDLEARLDKIEAMIQSVTILPAYTDGSVEAVDSMLTIDFVVSPAAAVKGVTKDSIIVLVHEAKVQTKAASYTTIPVASADVNEATGDVTITADISKITPAEGKGLTVAVNIKNGISDFTTEFFPISVIKSSVTLRLTAEVSPGKNAYFRNTHCCFSPDRKTAYLPTQNGNLVAVDLVNHAVKWVWTTTEQLKDGCVNVACNPVTGDVYLRNKNLSNDGFFAISPDGNTKWTVNDIKPLGSCFAVSSDGAAILACGTSTTLMNANNREFGAFSATDGSQLDRCYQRGSEVSGEGVVDPFMYCNNAQMAIYKTDATYDYIVLHGNELLQFYTYNRATKKFKAIKMVHPYDTWKSWGDACSISPAVSPEGKIFIPSNTKGVITVIDGSVAEPWNSISWMMKKEKNITGIVFDTDGNMIIGTRDGMIKVSKDKLAGGPKDNPVDPTIDAIYVASIGKDVFTHSYPYVSASGDVYAACNNADATLCGDIYYVPAASTGTCAPVEVYHSGTTTSAQGCFCVTDGALIFPTCEPAEIILKTNNGLKMPKTWCGYGGDPCASMNVAFAYGNK